MAATRIVGIILLNHQATINLLAGTDHRLQVHNLLLLLPVSVLPWPTALLAEYTRDGTAADQQLAVIIYGLTSTRHGRHLQSALALPTPPPRTAQAGHQPHNAQSPRPPLHH